MARNFRDEIRAQFPGYPDTQYTLKKERGIKQPPGPLYTSFEPNRALFFLGSSTIIRGVRGTEISGQEHEIFSGLGREPENFEILERVGIWKRIGNMLK